MSLAVATGTNARHGRRAAVAALCGLSLASLAGVAEPDKPPQAEPAPAYVDRLMEGVPAQLDLVDDGSASYDRSGMPRTLRGELRAQSSSDERGSASALWANLRGSIDTANHGAFSFDASGQLLDRRSGQRRGTGATFSLYQTAMPFGGGWYASQGLGVIQTLGTRLGAQQASFFVPTRLVQGASTQWRSDARGITLQLSGGETGSFASIGHGSFYGSGNRVATLGLELGAARLGGISMLPTGWAYSAVAGHATGAEPQTVPGFGMRTSEPAGSGILQSLRWESPAAFVQGNLLAGRNQDSADPLTGAPGASASRAAAWLDGALRSADITHRWGVHHLAQGLRWQGSALGGNSQGGYYRWSRIGLRTQVEAQLSSTQPVDVAAGGVTQHRAGVSLRHQIDQRLGVGGLVQLSEGTSSDVQVSAFSELRRPWADLRLQAGIETRGGAVVARRLSSDQAWALPLGQRLSSSLALNSTSSSPADSGNAASNPYGTTFEMAVAGGADIGDSVSLDLNLRALLPQSAQLARAYNLSASGQWRLTSAWTLAAALGMTRSSGVASTGTINPIPILPGSTTSFIYPGTRSRDLWLTLRYDFQAGAAVVPIGVGGRVGTGGGNIEGVVYLDDNQNGRLDALEARAANVTVMLDGRFATRTDAQGRFEFPFVASGPHAIAVASDTLPLPWVAPASTPMRVDVVPRGVVRVEIGATRDRAATTEP